MILDTIQHSGGFTTLFFASPGLRFRYVRKTVTINANVAPATHGDTVTEVLGSGDAARPNQAFVLKKPPLTYTPSADPSGAAELARGPGEPRPVVGVAPPVRPRRQERDVHRPSRRRRQGHGGVRGRGAGGAPADRRRERGRDLPERHRAGGHGRRRQADAPHDAAPRHSRGDESAARRPAPRIPRAATAPARTHHSPCSRWAASSRCRTPRISRAPSPGSGRRGPSRCGGAASSGST